MSLPRYPVYKDSGVAWLGEVPGHWGIAPFYSVATEREEPNVGMQENNLLSLSYGRIVQKDINSNDGLLPESFETYQVIRPGDIVFRLTDLQNDKRSLRTAIVEETGIITSAYIAAKPVSIEPCYLSRLLRAYDVTKVFYSMGGGLRQSMKFFDLKRLPTLLPPPEEQTAIAAFLDRETGKIDALVAEQEKLIALLKEKRQAVISHAVTKGLNPAARMKDSGIEWLGEVPVHWELKRLKYLGEAITGLTYSPSDIVDDDTSGMLVLRSSNVQGGVITFDDNVYVSAAIPEELVTQVGDILICSRNGSRALIGKNATIDETSSGLTFGAFMTIFRSRHSAYLSCVLNSPLFEFQSGAFMTSTINQLTIGVLNNFEVPLPPENERAEIAAYLAVEFSKFDTLAAEAQRGIALLKERRSALISAAVTGKIDVRHPLPKPGAA